MQLEDYISNNVNFNCAKECLNHNIYIIYLIKNYFLSIQQFVLRLTIMIKLQAIV